MLLPISQISLTQAIAAIGALGTAAYGIVDASKSGLSFINRLGLKHIKTTIELLAPLPDGENSLERKHILETVEANWINGADLAKQKCVAVSLILGHLTQANAATMAAHTNVDAATLGSIAAKTLAGVCLDAEETAVETRFELILNTYIDEAYQRADERYRNGTRTLAGWLAIGLAIAGGWVITGDGFWQVGNVVRSLLVGLLAVPLAPIAKDVSSAVAAVSDLLQVPKTGAAPAPAARAPMVAAVAAVAAARPEVEVAAAIEKPAPDA